MAILKDPVLEKLRVVAERLNAIAVTETSEKDYLEYRKANGAENVYMIYPKVKVQSGDKIEDAPASAAVAGIFAGLNFWESPSNKLINGVLGTSTPISFALDDPLSDGQSLNSAQISTIVRQDGLRLWGSRGTGDQTDLKTNFIHKVRIRNSIREALISGHRWALAKNMGSQRYFDEVATSVTNYLARLQRDGAIAGGVCYPDEESNTPDALADGKAYFVFEYTPSPVSERLTFKERITNDYLKTLGG
ncbi:phage tail sheath family protein [Pseudobacteriovorax antillogorgiicola]|nr:phage tail sheath subtilisin-like domain-containing protein [Pseudobacteriovorax antillogorgiicola]TCS44267.1 tail sheath protein [Pseudobacteriovorax antillogorgiicola]